MSQYLQEHRDQLAVFKLRNNEQLTQQDIKVLEDILWKELGTREDYEKSMGIRQLQNWFVKLSG